MAVTDTQLLLRMEASLSKFEKQMARGREVGARTAQGIEDRFANSNRKMAQSAEASAAAIGREMERLRTKYDPVYAASKKYETALEELNRAQKVGALNAVQHEAALERLNAEYAASTGMAQRAAASTTALAVANGRVATTSRGMGGGIQNMSYQVADFATQVGAGTAASMALGQQLPQMLAGFGIMGAVLGAVVAVGVPLTSMLMGVGRETDTLEDKLDTLKSSVDDYTSAVQAASAPTDELAEKYGSATAAAREFIIALREIAEVDALTALSATLDGIVAGLGSFYRVRAEAGSLPGMDSIKMMGEDLGVAAHNAGEVAIKFQDLEQAEGPQAQLEAIQALMQALEDALGPYDNMNAAAQKVHAALGEAGVEAARLAGTADGAASAISRAASEAGQLADELSRAVDNAMSLAAQGMSNVRRAEIEWQYKDDPIGKAGALADHQFDRSVGDTTGLDPVIQEGLAADRDEFVKNAKTAEGYNQKIQAWRKDQQEAAKAAAKAERDAASSAKKAARTKANEEPLFQASDEELLSIERKIDMIGREAGEIASLQSKYALLDEAKRRGLDLDARQSESGETLRDEIERQSAAVGRLAVAYDDAKVRADFFADAQRTVEDGMIDAIMEGENLAGVLGDVAKMFARAAIEASLFGRGGLANGGGGLLGGLMSGLSGLMGGGRAAGGAVTAGKVYRVNEHGGEGFVPAVNGRVLSLAQTQKMQEAAGPSVSLTYSPVNDFRGVDGAVISRVLQQQARLRSEIPALVLKTLRASGNQGVTGKVLRNG